MEMLGLFFALIIGVTLGMLGGGGSILTVPVFVYVLGFDPKLAIAMSLPVVAATSLVGAVTHWRAGNVRVASALPFGVMAMIGAFGGARLSAFVSGQIQLAALGAAMLAAAIVMWRNAAPATSPDTGMADPATLPASRATFLIAGLAVGVLTGMVGIGGGFLIVPALVVLARIPMREAVGTSLTVIAMNGIAGFAGQRDFSRIPLGFVLVFSAIAMAGIVAGTVFVRWVRQRTLKRAFSVLLFIIAALMLWQNRTLIQ